MKKNVVKKTTVAKPVSIKKDKIIPAAAAARIRMEIMKLDRQVCALIDEAGNAKKETGIAKNAVKNQPDSMSEMGEMESMRLQMAMDRLSKMMTTMSNMMKKISDTAKAITQNIK